MVFKTPEINYQKWVDGKNFSLGDFLIFNTDKNHSVIQTYNQTTYKECDYYDATDATTEWSTAQPAVDNTPVTVAVPLLKEGTTYFFSGNYDGEQCQHGQHFEIDVSHGAGLPPDLKSQYSSSGGGDSPGPSVSTPGADDQSTPDTVIPSNFNEPTDNGKAKEASTSAAVVGGGGGLGPVGVALVVGWAWMFCLSNGDVTLVLCFALLLISVVIAAPASPIWIRGGEERRFGGTSVMREWSERRSGGILWSR
ncbi:hypothetical protein QJS10_CPA05g00694 [Acorus calamus]|uniref:Phytocyanin domain-containing protein n=1 Tax=Acorus calamus TaxID=4465 RepID=A0AAV9EUN8_ACOCL|nr:hypothetical protein QJS10_CPA05g00694 [Acorus calamus]